MKRENRILNIINANLIKCLVILIVSAHVNIISGVICVIGSFSALAFSSLFSFGFSLYAISNVVGAKYGKLFNMHTIRYHILREKDRESEYGTSCLKYIAVMLPISVIWSTINLVYAIIKIVTA